MRAHLCLCSLFWVSLAAWAAAADPPVPVRVAVIGDADQQGLAALVTAELSQEGAISLVEHDDLAKVGDELTLQRLAGSNAVALGKQLGADGILFVSKGLSDVQVRFTAVESLLGISHGDNVVDQSLDHRVVRDLPVVAAKETKPCHLAKVSHTYGDERKAFPFDLAHPNVSANFGLRGGLAKCGLAAMPLVFHDGGVAPFTSDQTIWRDSSGVRGVASCQPDRSARDANRTPRASEKWNKSNNHQISRRENLKW